MPKPPIINIDDVPLMPRPQQYAPTGPAAERYDARAGFIGSVLGAQKLGYSVTAIAPGKRAFPFHNHQFNEEMFFVLEGTGEVRIGAETYPIRQGDIIACPPGGKETAHQIINTGEVELKYLGVSTNVSPDYCDYPDSGKWAVRAQLAPEDGKPRIFAGVGRIGPDGQVEGANYWEGE